MPTRFDTSILTESQDARAVTQQKASRGTGKQGEFPSWAKFKKRNGSLEPLSNGRAGCAPAISRDFQGMLRINETDTRPQPQVQTLLTQPVVPMNADLPDELPLTPSDATSQTQHMSSHFHRQGLLSQGFSNSKSGKPRYLHARPPNPHEVSFQNSSRGQFEFGSPDNHRSFVLSKMSQEDPQANTDPLSGRLTDRRGIFAENHRPMTFKITMIRNRYEQPQAKVEPFKSKQSPVQVKLLKIKNSNFVQPRDFPPQSGTEMEVGQHT